MDFSILPEIQSTDKDAGIYAILNRNSGKFYIGRANNLRSRRTRHLSALIRKDHANEHLQRSFNLHGKESFKWLVIEKCSLESLKDKEQFYLDKFFGLEACYNINPNSQGGGVPGRKFSSETLIKMKTSHLGKKHTQKRAWHPLSSSHRIAISYGNSKLHKVLSPSGKVIEILNLKAYSKDNNLIPSCMYEVILGNTARKSHRGYRNICELGVNT